MKKEKKMKCKKSMQSQLNNQEYSKLVIIHKFVSILHTNTMYVH